MYCCRYRDVSDITNKFREYLIQFLSIFDTILEHFELIFSQADCKGKLIVLPVNFTRCVINHPILNIYKSFRLRCVESTARADRKSSFTSN